MEVSPEEEEEEDVPVPGEENDEKDEEGEEEEDFVDRSDSMSGEEEEDDAETFVDKIDSMRGEEEEEEDEVEEEEEPIEVVVDFASLSSREDPSMESYRGSKKISIDKKSFFWILSYFTSPLAFLSCSRWNRKELPLLAFDDAGSPDSKEARAVNGKSNRRDKCIAIILPLALFFYSCSKIYSNGSL